jgi:biopolymer transport protein ExbD
MPAKAFDVWFLAANTVYRGVPYSVVTGWAEQGRVSGDDKVRASGSDEGWLRLGDHPDLSDFLFARGGGAAPAVAARPAEELEPIAMDAGWNKTKLDEDDDPDMIPLIDISLVLLIFFMMTASVAALSPINVPEMKHAADLRADPDALTVNIDKNARDELYYALRVADKAPERDDNNLNSLPDLLARLNKRLDEILSAGGRPPEVRIACHKDLPSERVHELAKELERLKTKGRIAFYGAEVNEKK